MRAVQRFEIYQTELSGTVGSEIRKNRPCLIVSPDEMSVLRTVIVAPLTSKGFEFPTRVPIKFADKTGFVLLDQIRTVDKSRLGQCLGKIDTKTTYKVLDVLQAMFAY